MPLCLISTAVQCCLLPSFIDLSSSLPVCVGSYQRRNASLSRTACVRVSCIGSQRVSEGNPANDHGWPAQEKYPTDNNNQNPLSLSQRQRERRNKNDVTTYQLHGYFASEPKPFVAFFSSRVSRSLWILPGLTGVEMFTAFYPYQNQNKILVQKVLVQQVS